jgi:ACS family glucarate transporter-like MFS transporter
LPWLAATVAVPAFGFISTQLGLTYGMFRSRRFVAALCLVAAAGLLALGAQAHTIAVALGSISASVALLFSTESSYWSSAIELAEEDAGAASGLMNLAGNLGGVISTLLVPVIATNVNWTVALISGAVTALAAAVSWFAIAVPKETAYE